MDEQQKIVVVSRDELKALIREVVSEALGSQTGDQVDRGDRLLKPEEAAPMLNVTKRWMYAHAKKLPFTRRLSRKALRFSEVGLLRWKSARKNI